MSEALSLVRRLAQGEARAVAAGFLLLGAAFLGLGGILAVALRAQLAWPALLGLSPAGYGAAFTMHGLVMVFWAVTPLWSGFATLVVPRHAGAARPAFPRLASLALALHAASGGLALASFVMPFGPAAAGWTGYPPLSSSAPGLGPSIVLAGLLLAGLATVLVSIHVIATAGWRRAPGLRVTQLPLATWGFLLAAALNVIFLPVLAAASGLVLLDRHAGTSIFAAAPGGDPLLYQHLFWLFGHPQVYVLILPAWGLVSDVLARAARRPPAWPAGTIGALATVAALSGLVYGHHLYVAGLGPLASRAFQALTLLITLPATVLVVNWLRTLHGGALRLDPAALFALAFVVVFGAGGLTGVPLGAAATDMALHDSMAVVGHFHLTMAASVLLALGAALHEWLPLLSGRSLDGRLARWHAGLTSALLPATFAAVLAAGWLGQPRRVADPVRLALGEPLRSLNVAASGLALAVAASQLLLVAALVLALRRARPSGGADTPAGTA